MKEQRFTFILFFLHFFIRHFFSPRFSFVSISIDSFIASPLFLPPFGFLQVPEVMYVLQGECVGHLSGENRKVFFIPNGSWIGSPPSPFSFLFPSSDPQLPFPLPLLNQVNLGTFSPPLRLLVFMEVLGDVLCCQFLILC